MNYEDFFHLKKKVEMTGSDMDEFPPAHQQVAFQLDSWQPE